MKRVAPLLALAGLAAGAPSLAQDATRLRDLDAAARVTLSKDELQQLMPGATVSRVSGRGNRNIWKNEPGGSFVASSDNKDRGSTMPSTARGQWSLSDDGRYCVRIEWRSVETEDWCRFIVRAGNAYYGTRSDQNPDERIYRLEITK
ncbi:MAG: DUF995 domain-containing protein [Hydrogenophaga sp.]|uniref:DUF995 domain-containing protein n=1 Tax=Hydrogenophaga sp. TaxID=1904254 RepID=UPI0016A817E3|nr:DUF995 domain-containing protein [Hydrogenophaga sp.]NIM39663.1 DUF995 domain-containing protein [Hydrogenophaga sp.]NIN24867.1 DUF995 domain-containing protein [Hydrogenophaga sp.]NIN29379.1 DUF995 domain-containing protein [Hydrogenophaga sp.]NIN53902.1 DUF995 domain-containing protein [Hydrogenophaga sp.]NIO50106.1 DUF995 domain-containing protein [Hydrogenophaga sp.]